MPRQFSAKLASEQVVKKSTVVGSLGNSVFKQTEFQGLILIVSACVLFIGFKWFYPYPSFFYDGYSYIYAAAQHLDVNIWPIGYSRFLSFFHSITTSAGALVGFQFIVFLLSALYFYFTIHHFFLLSKHTRLILSFFLFYNPLFYYLNNYISSDGLFITLSLLWFTQLIWMIHQPNVYLFCSQGIITFILFTLRYNAMIYPIVAIVPFIFIKAKVWQKILGISVAPMLIIPFIIFTGNAAKRITGVTQFPPIRGGWQWANNALYMRDFLSIDSKSFPTKETQELDQTVQNYFKTIPSKFRNLSASEVDFFICDLNSPLYQYMHKHYRPDPNYDSTISAWGRAAVVFDHYGKYLISRYPLSFSRHFLLINASKYFLPPLEVLEVYNTGRKEMQPTAQLWFHYPNRRVSCFSYTCQQNILRPFSLGFMIANILLVLTFSIAIQKRLFNSTPKTINYTVLTTSIFIFLNFSFSTFANIINLRYQIFPMILIVTLCIILLDQLERFSVGKKTPKILFAYSKCND